ncbi:MAG: nucleotidyltransferase family protein [Chitinophagaceae bacterium]|nr:nucleotidyltransferase family protein [Chitinophagaceae bacterium]
MFSTAQIVDILKAKKPDLVKRYPISELGLFGSYARTDFNAMSDIDILVDFDKNIDAFTFIRLAHELEDLFLHKIDLVSRKGIKPQWLLFVEKNLIHV